MGPRARRVPRSAFGFGDVQRRVSRPGGLWAAGVQGRVGWGAGGVCFFLACLGACSKFRAPFFDSFGIRLVFIWCSFDVRFLVFQLGLKKVGWCGPPCAAAWGAPLGPPGVVSGRGARPIGVGSFLCNSLYNIVFHGI